MSHTDEVFRLMHSAPLSSVHGLAFGVMIATREAIDMYGEDDLPPVLANFMNRVVDVGVGYETAMV